MDHDSDSSGHAKIQDLTPKLTPKSAACVSVSTSFENRNQVMTTNKIPVLV